MTKIQITPKYSEVKPRGSYVYLHRKASDGSVFYVGKGRRDRGWQASKACQRSNWWLGVARKYGVIVEIFKDNMSDPCALTLEKILISKHRSNGCALVNISDGGDGASGYSRAGVVYRSDGKSYRSCTEAADDLVREGIYTASASKISYCASGNRHTAYGYCWSFDSVPDRPLSLKDRRRNWYGVKVYCSNGSVFRSIKDAADWVRISTKYSNASSANISACARGVRPNAYGLNWDFTSVPHDPIIRKRQS